MQITPLLSETMRYRDFAGVKLFRPRTQTEIIVRNAAERHLREGYPTGSYTARDKINEILQYKFGYFYSVLQREIPKSASRHLMEFLLAQYDATALILDKQRNGELSGADNEYWSKHGPEIRRAIKHLAELVVMLAPDEAPRLNQQALLLNAETIVICAECLVESSGLSDQTFALHPDETTFTIYPEGLEIYWELKVSNFDHYGSLAARVAADTQSKSDCFSSQEPQYDLDFQSQMLDNAFELEFGISYRKVIGLFAHLIDTTIVSDPNAFDTPFLKRDFALESLIQDLGCSPKSAEKILSGFTLTTTNLTNQGKQGRVIYKPKQEYRALRRGFFEMPHPIGQHITWSRQMARECLLEVMKGTVFQKVPPEWASPRVNSALASLQRKAGVWFESQVDQNMSKLGFKGRPSIKQGIGQGADRISIPDHVGELDYLGFHAQENLLVLLEDKMTHGGADPTHFRDDISDFATGKSPYVEQLRRKFEWVRNNIDAICNAISSALPETPIISRPRLAGALVTFQPTYASYFVKDFPCDSLSELIAAYKAAGRWPYDVGITA